MKSKNRLNRNRETWIAYLFLIPAIVCFLVFMVYPVVFSLILSFSKWNLVSGIGGIKLIGLTNFIEVFQSDRFFASLKNNLFYTVAVVPLTLIFSLVIAYILNEYTYYKKALRLFFFIPYISNVVAVSVVWKSMFRPMDGPINQLLAKLGVVDLPQWTSDKDLALIPIIVLAIWMGIGYDIIIYMAALQGVPRELYEAGEIDGAVGVNRFIRITLPTLSPTTFFLIITRIIASFQVFAPIRIMTQGGPGSATTVLVYEIYTEAFMYYNYGYSSAIAWILFLIILTITILQMYGEKKWVHYS